MAQRSDAKRNPPRFSQLWTENHLASDTRHYYSVIRTKLVQPYKTMKSINLLYALIVMGVTLTNAAAQTSVTVANFSFENPSTASYSLTVPNSWAFGGPANDQGVQTFANGAIAKTGPADGNQVYFINSASGATDGVFLTQDVGTLLANTTYSLTVAEAVAPAGSYGSNPGTLELALFNGTNSTGSLLASLPESLTPSLTTTGTLVDYNLAFTTSSSVSGDLTIGLANNTPTGITQGDFDNVRLTEETAPEPSIYLLLVTGVMALVAVRTRVSRLG